MFIVSLGRPFSEVALVFFDVLRRLYGSRCGQGFQSAYCVATVRFVTMIGRVGMKKEFRFLAKNSLAAAEMSSGAGSVSEFHLVPGSYCIHSPPGPKGHSPVTLQFRLNAIKLHLSFEKLSHCRIRVSLSHQVTYCALSYSHERRSVTARIWGTFLRTLSSSG